MLVRNNHSDERKITDKETFHNCLVSSICLGTFVWNLPFLDFCISHQPNSNLQIKIDMQTWVDPAMDVLVPGGTPTFMIQFFCKIIKNPSLNLISIDWLFDLINQTSTEIHFQYFHYFLRTQTIPSWTMCFAWCREPADHRSAEVDRTERRPSEAGEIQWGGWPKEAAGMCGRQWGF